MQPDHISCLEAEIPYCDAHSTSHSAVVTFAVDAAVSLFCCLWIGVKYTSVNIFARKIQSDSISYILWQLFFGVSAAWSVGWSTRLGTADIPLPEEKCRAMFNFLLDLGLCAVVLLLSLSLDYQRKFLSPEEPTATTKASINRDYFPGKGLVRSSNLRRAIWFLLSKEHGFLYFLCACLYLAANLCFHLASPRYEHVTAYTLIAAYALQRVPVFWFSYIIVWQRPYTPVRSRIHLSLATLLYSLNFVPLYFWAGSVKDVCIGGSLSIVDVLNIARSLSSLFYLLFIRMEYRRNATEYMWHAVGQIDDEEEER